MNTYEIAEIVNVTAHPWSGGENPRMDDRPSHGLVITDNCVFDFFQDGKTVTCDREHLLILPQGSSYSFRCVGGRLSYLINFKGKIAQDRIYAIPTALIDTIVPVVTEMIRVSGKPYQQMSLLYRMLALLHKEHVENAVPPVIRPQVRYIRENPSAPDLDNKTLAQMTNISEVYFRKVFRASFGMPPHLYIVRCRIEMAKQLLQTGDYSISEAAAACGYSSLYYFSSAFKRETGVSPSEFVRLLSQM